jgi:hypothetical protein
MLRNKTKKSAAKLGNNDKELSLSHRQKIRRSNVTLTAGHSSYHKMTKSKHRLIRRSAKSTYLTLDQIRDPQ